MQAYPHFSMPGSHVTLNAIPRPVGGAGLNPDETSITERRRPRRMAITFAVVVLFGMLLAPISATALVVHWSSTVARGITVTPPPGGVLVPGSQIAFRGVPAHQLRVSVTGSSSGLHAGIPAPPPCPAGGDVRA